MQLPPCFAEATQLLVCHQAGLDTAVIRCIVSSTAAHPHSHVAVIVQQRHKDLSPVHVSAGYSDTVVAQGQCMRKTACMKAK